MTSHADEVRPSKDETTDVSPTTAKNKKDEGLQRDLVRVTKTEVAEKGNASLVEAITAPKTPILDAHLTEGTAVRIGPITHGKAALTGAKAVKESNQIGGGTTGERADLEIATAINPRPAGIVENSATIQAIRVTATEETTGRLITNLGTLARKADVTKNSKAQKASKPGKYKA